MKQKSVVARCHVNVILTLDFWRLFFFYSYKEQILVGDLFDDPCNKKKIFYIFLLCSIINIVSQINIFFSIFLHGKNFTKIF